MKQTKRGWIAMTLALSGLAPLGTANAQRDMEFSVDDIEPGASAAPVVAAPPPADGPPSEAFANAQALYARREYRQAAVQFQRVIDGETRDFPAKVQQAQFFLGKTLYHLRYLQSALAVFDEISLAGPGHLYYDETLQWLVQLATQLPESAGITERIGRYPLQQLEQFNTAAAATGDDAPESNESGNAAFDHLLYLMGRYNYDQQQFATAAALFERVRPSSPLYADALFMNGVTNVRLRRGSPAIDAFRRLIRGAEAGTLGGEEASRFRNLGWISLGRVYYTASQSRDAEGNIQVDGRLLGQAVEAWNQVSTSSEYWLDAVFESSWAFFLSNQYARSLGNIHSINSPYFPNAFYPEGLVIKAVTFFSNCQIENAIAMIQQFHTRYDPVKEQLNATLGNFADNAQFFDFLKQVRDGTAEMPESIRPVVTSALSDRTLLRHIQYVGLLRDEEQRLAAEPEQFRNSTVGARIGQDISLGISFGIDGAGNVARSRYTRVIDELDELSNQVARVQVEILTFQRGQITQETRDQMTTAASSSGGDVDVDYEHQRWPFDGEYWRDELGYYRQQVTNRCGR